MNADVSIPSSAVGNPQRGPPLMINAMVLDGYTGGIDDHYGIVLT
jgi:hypothetical protein